MKYRKKPVVIEAVQLLWSTWSEMCDHAGVGHLSDGKPSGCYIDPTTGQSTGQKFLKSKPDGEAELGLSIPTLEGLMTARENEWVIRGVKGELYPCKPDIFKATYEAVT